MAMKMDGEYLLPADRETVWQALNDPDALAQCIPGCEELEKVSDTEFKAVVVSKIGPVKARFKGDVTLSDLNPPEAYRISGQGQGGVAGFAKGGADIRLAAEGSETRLTYTADAQVGGKLAQIGQRLVNGAAKSTADKFFENLRRYLGGEDEEAEKVAG